MNHEEYKNINELGEEDCKNSRNIDKKRELKLIYNIEEKVLEKIIYKYEGNLYRVEKYFKFLEKYLKIKVIIIFLSIISIVFGKLGIFTVFLAILQMVWIFKIIYINIGFNIIITLFLFCIINVVTIPLIFYLFLFNEVFKTLLGV